MSVDLSQCTAEGISCIANLAVADCSICDFPLEIGNGGWERHFWRPYKRRKDEENEEEAEPQELSPKGDEWAASTVHPPAESDTTHVVINPQIFAYKSAQLADIRKEAVKVYLREVAELKKKKRQEEESFLLLM